LSNSSFVKAAFEKGFDLATYKTVRTREHACHPWPNVVPVEVDGDLTMEKKDEGLTMADDYSDPVAATNSFGVPSKSPDVWQPDMKKAVESAGKGQVMIASFQGTNRGEGVEAFVQDHIDGAKMCVEAGAKIVEVNYSCPNEGTANLLCYDTERVITISEKIKEEIGDVPLLIKIAYFSDKEAWKDYVKRVGKVVDGIAMINTIGAAVRKKDGEQALPGDGRLVSGVLGGPIKWAGLEMVKEAVQWREEFGSKFKIIASGGVTSVESYKEYIDAGADAVMSGGGSMWNPYLAQEIKKEVLK
jgi:dihydroorotate dehydrogenase